MVLPHINRFLTVVRDRRVFFFEREKRRIMTKVKQKSNLCNCKASSFTEDRQQLQEIISPCKKLLNEVAYLKSELAINKPKPTEA